MSISADVRMTTIKKSYRYNQTVVLKLTINYPKIWLMSNQKAQARINRYITMQVNRYIQYVSTTLYKNAVSFYQDAQKNEFPFHAYEAVMNYEITYNYSCYFSTYHDQYEYTGGAHGNTTRLSDTWSLSTGSRLPLSYYFKPGTNYQKMLIDEILMQADANSSNYFEEYRSLIVQNFNEKNYYLTPEGFVIYYQQYEIAPYSTGIVVFTIPYTLTGWKPSCKK